MPETEARLLMPQSPATNPRSTPRSASPAAGRGFTWKRGEFWTGCRSWSLGAESIELKWRGKTHHFGRRRVLGIVSEHWGIYQNTYGPPSHPFCVVHLRSGCAAGYFKRQKDAKAFAAFFHAAHPEYATTGTWGGLGMKALGRRANPTARKGYERFNGYTPKRILTEKET